MLPFSRAASVSMLFVASIVSALVPVASATTQGLYALALSSRELLVALKATFGSLVSDPHRPGVSVRGLGSRPLLLLA